MGNTVHSGLGLIMKFFILLGLFVATNAQPQLASNQLIGGFPLSTTYDFEPVYSRTSLNPNQLHTFQWRRMAVDMASSKVRCIGNLRRSDNTRIEDACRDFEHNDQLIRRVRCDNCRYHADATILMNGQLPRLDYTTCNCRIDAGELVEGQGPLMRGLDGSVVRTGGVEQRYDPEYRLVESSLVARATRQNANTDGDRIRVVCDPDANGRPQNHLYEFCHVELTIEHCPFVTRNAAGAMTVDGHTDNEEEAYVNEYRRPERRCYVNVNNNRQRSYAPRAAGK